MLASIHRALDRLVLAITIPLTVAMLGCVVWQVVARYALNVSTSATDEIARFAFIWVSLLGSAYVLGKRGHIAITGWWIFCRPGRAAASRSPLRRWSRCSP